MKVNLRSLVLTGIMALACCMLPQISTALGEDEFTDPDTPIDGGVGILIAAGIAYGIKRTRDEKNKKQGKLP